MTFTETATESSSPQTSGELTPFELVLQHFILPEKVNGRDFIPLPKQVEAINRLAPLQNQGHWLDMGTGKTFVSTMCALYWMIVAGNASFVVMPPLLIKQWAKWLRLIRYRETGEPLTVTAYRGTPKQRAAMSLDVDFVVVGVQIFKRDYDRFVTYFSHRRFTVIVDEANIIAGVGSAQHQLVFDFAIGHVQMLLTGTPINKPGDGYGLLKFVAPGTYRNLLQFENLHVAERDFFNMPTEYQNLDLLRSNMEINSMRILYRDMYSATETPLYVPLDYDLEPDHYKLYTRLSNDQLLKLPDGGKIDGTTANRLRHALGQIVVNLAHFSQDPSAKSNAILFIEERLAEMGDGKLLIFAHYKMTVAATVQALKKYGALAINSEVSAVQKDKNVEAFIQDPACRVLVVQYISGGKGLDGLQFVCHTVMCIEPCQQPRDFHQAIARLDRTGQTQRVLVLLAIANGTLQRRGFDKLIENDTIVNQVVRSAVELREEIFGR